MSTRQAPSMTSSTRRTSGWLLGLLALLLSCAGCLGGTPAFATWYHDDASDDSCGFKGKAATGPMTVAVSSGNWPWGSPPGAAAGTLCGMCFEVSCNPGASTYGKPGTYCKGSAIVQITNNCPECLPVPQWGSCTECNGFHVDLRREVYQALTGCDPQSHGCSMPGVLPVIIGDPVPCPHMNPSIHYRDSEAFYQSFQITGVDRTLATPALVIRNSAKTFREQAMNKAGGRIFALDATTVGELPPVMEMEVRAADGSTALCSVTTGAIGQTFDCGGWGGANSNPVQPSLPEPPTDNGDSQAQQNVQIRAVAAAVDAINDDGNDAGRVWPEDCFSLNKKRNVKKCLKSKGLWKTGAQATQSGPPAGGNGGGSLKEWSSCGASGHPLADCPFGGDVSKCLQMPYADASCQPGLVCCKTSNTYAQCSDPTMCTPEENEEILYGP